MVNIFCDAEKACYLPPKTVELAAGKDRIVAHESFDKWGIDQAAWLG